MNKSKSFFGLGIGLFIFAVLWVRYAFSHPMAAFPWDNAITYTMYWAYLILMVTMFVLAKKHKK